jgi:hypothetical protein
MAATVRIDHNDKIRRRHKFSSFIVTATQFALTGIQERGEQDFYFGSAIVRVLRTRNVLIASLFLSSGILPLSAFEAKPFFPICVKSPIGEGVSPSWFQFDQPRLRIDQEVHNN